MATTFRLWGPAALCTLMFACSATERGQDRLRDGAFPADLYLKMTDGNGQTTSWGPLASEDGRYYDIRPLVPADGIYEFVIESEDQSLLLGYDRLEFDPDDAVATLQGSRNPEAFRFPLRGPQSYRFLFDTQNVSKPLLTVTTSQTLNSVEYKLMLQPAKFSDVSGSVETLRDQVEVLVKDTLGASAWTLGAKGLPEEAGDTKLVYFYDTPRSCMFNRVGLIVRERKGVLSGAREFTLKVRGSDEAEVSQAFVSTKYPVSDSKLEEEVSFAGNKDVYDLKKSYSYSVDQIAPEDQAMSTISDFQNLYVDYSKRTDTPDLNPYEPIRSTVSGGLLEKVYVIGTVNLADPSEASMLRKIELTLWFRSVDSVTPIVAELSFKMKEASGAFSKSNRQRSDAIFEKMNRMEYWVSPDGITKTKFAYGFDPSFCL